MIDYEYIEEVIKPEYKKLEREREHLLNQIEMFEDMIHNYKLSYRENDRKLAQLNLILHQIK